MKSLITVSIVEDLDDVREGLIQLLNNADDFAYLTAYKNAETACEELPSLQPDIASMDINLPGISGIDCLRKIKSLCHDTQFIMFTIYEDSEQVFEALAAGANGYLLKKTPPEKILEALQEMHNGGAPMNTHIARKVVNYFSRATVNEESAVLSPREKEILEFLAKGFLYKEISSKLGISTGTVRQHIHKIYEKLHVQNRTEAINKVYRK